MGILQVTTDFVGEVGVNPRLVRILSDDNLATITAAGYLNKNAFGYSFLPTDIAQIAYDGGSGPFSLDFATNGVITMIQIGAGGSLPAYVVGITPGISAPNKALVLDGANQIDGTPWTAIQNAAALSNGVVEGVSESGKVLTLDGAAEIDSTPWADILSSGALTGGVVAGTSQASKVLSLDATNKLNGVGINAITNAGVLSGGVVAGTVIPSHVVSVDGLGKADTIDITALKLGGGSVNATAPEINYNAGVVLGQSSGNKVLTLDSLDQLDSQDWSDYTKAAAAVQGVISGIVSAGKAVIVDGIDKSVDVWNTDSLFLNNIQVTATAGEINYNAGVVSGNPVDGKTFLPGIAGDAVSSNVLRNIVEIPYIAGINFSFIDNGGSDASVTIIIKDPNGAIGNAGWTGTLYDCDLNGDFAGTGWTGLSSSGQTFETNAGFAAIYKTDGGGNLQFDISYAGPGTYYFALEINGSANVFQVTVTP